jgi:hypothetical protein
VGNMGQITSREVFVSRLSRHRPTMDDDAAACENSACSEVIRSFDTGVLAWGNLAGPFVYLLIPPCARKPRPNTNTSTSFVHSVAHAEKDWTMSV